MSLEIIKLLRDNIDKPKYDMDTFIGRFKHFVLLTNPLNLLASEERLRRARAVVKAYRAGTEVPFVNKMKDVWHEKYLYDSAYHSDTGEKIFILGRMSAQVPLNMILVSCMIVFYKNRFQVLFFQWLNQTFNSLVNYTSGSGASDMTWNVSGLIFAHVSATFGAFATALSLFYITRSMKAILLQRLIPFASVTAANCVNIPLMRQGELKCGIKLTDNNDCMIGWSRKAAMIGISQLVISHTAMCMPPMIALPIAVERLKRNGFLKSNSKWNISLQAGCVGTMLLFSIPFGCALYPPRSSIKVENLEGNLRKRIQHRCPNLKEVFYNRG